ncbi:hypothetical protein T492DRAFT_1009568 [Pavlovales sp. CCMP2436]|nr:hypothetical protein T492DRAFT_1009568 [Pavlovales sp. CCMP2436]|mmetsp:Transcript_29610/g.74484  ORF Transcript_29610/g.74484 Transcript_29610/m.74484 type:complete len:327 (+) Transcript_29610:183-1163(+)
MPGKQKRSVVAQPTAAPARPGARARKRAAQAKLALTAPPAAPGEPAAEEAARRPDAYAFVCEEADHAESPAAAYEHLAPLLAQLAAQLGKPASKLRIYDPYYCAGSVVKHLGRLGFTRVINRNEDFYAQIELGTVPEHDVIVTNPPYTSNHVQRLLNFCASIPQPCCLLLPSYVYCKDFYGEGSGSWGELEPFYLAPPCRYKYKSPQGALNAQGERRKSGSGSSGQVTAPFTSFWYLKAAPPTRAALQSWWSSGASSEARSGPCAGCVLVRGADELPHAMRDATDPSRKRMAVGEREQMLAQKRSADGRRLCTNCGQVWGNCKHTR